MATLTDNVSAQFLQDLLADIYQIFTGTGNEWVEEGLVRILTDVPTTRGLPAIKATNNPLGVNSPTPRAGDYAAGQVLNQRILETVGRMARIEITPADYEQTFESLRSSGLLNAMELNPELRAAVLLSFENAVSTFVSIAMSTGDGTDLTDGSNDWIEGFFELITTDANSIRTFLTPTNEAIDTTNILEIMELMIRLLPARLSRKKNRNTKFVMNKEMDNILNEANRLQAVTSVTYTQIGDFATFEGYEVKVVTTLPDDFIMLTPVGMDDESNLVMGTWLEADFDSLNIYLESPGDQLVQGVLRFQVGVQLRAAEDVVWYASDVLVPPPPFLVNKDAA